MKKSVTYTIDEEVIERLKKLSDKTMIPQTRLVQKAIEELLKKEEKDA